MVLNNTVKMIPFQYGNTVVDKTGPAAASHTLRQAGTMRYGMNGFPLSWSCVFVGQVCRSSFSTQYIIASSETQKESCLDSSLTCPVSLVIIRAGLGKTNQAVGRTPSVVHIMLPIVHGSLLAWNRSATRAKYNMRFVSHVTSPFAVGQIFDLHSVLFDLHGLLPKKSLACNT